MTFTDEPTGEALASLDITCQWLESTYVALQLDPHDLELIVDLMDVAKTLITAGEVLLLATNTNQPEEVSNDE